MELESESSPRTETGGVIVGRGEWLDSEVSITGVSGPGPRAVRTRYSFQRDIKHCQDYLNRIARESSGLLDYLGEWHKHHETDPWPSGQDLTTLATIALDPNYHVSVPILIIIGSSNNRSSLRAFSVDSLRNVQLLNWSIKGV
ncbi:MAG TPA: Mov34/MPN/PAD-1 family protein [Pyrinomonadaceae bacterium]|nr:Mov34/MPN/PAD-1 family protein [Pyrinomonadaceae bacterium]